MRDDSGGGDSGDGNADVLTGLDFLLSQQSGTVSRAQALADGISAKALEVRLRTGRWRRLHPGVYTTQTGPVSRTAVLWAAVLYAGKGAVLSHESAAEIHRFGDESALVHVTVPSHRRVQERPGLRIHRSSRIVLDPMTRSGLPAITATETVLDLIDTSESLDDAYGWITRACGRHRTSPEKLQAALARRKRLRRRRDIVIALGAVRAGAMSPLELRYVRDVERPHRLPIGERQRGVTAGGGRRRQRQDVHYDRFGVTIELDGKAYHPAELRDPDRRRDNESAARGEVTMRFGWNDVSEEPCRVAHEVARTLIRRGWDARGLRTCGRPGCEPEHLSP